MYDLDQWGAQMSDEKPSFKNDVKDVRDGMVHAAKASDQFVSHGTSRVIGPTATKALAGAKYLVNRVVTKLTGRG